MITSGIEKLRNDPLRAGGIALAVVVALVGLLAPFVLTSAWLTVYVLLGTSAMVTVGVALLMGYAGQVSLGQATFYGIGAYTAALLSMHGVPSIIGLLCAPLVAAAIAALIGLPILRLRGHYLAFATLAMQLILLAIVGQLDFFGGDIGLQGIPRLGVGGATLSDPRAYAWLTWLGVAVVLLVSRNIMASRPGRGLRALASSEVAAASSGVPVARYRVSVFALSAGFAGLAGGIYAFFIGYIAPGSFPVLLSFEFVVMAVVGGLGTVWGPVLGSVVITILVQVLTSLGTAPGMPAYASSVFSYAVYALLLVLVLLFLPRGLLPSATSGLRRLTGGRRPPKTPGPAAGSPEDTAVGTVTKQ